MNEPLLSVRHVKKWFTVRSMGRSPSYVKAVNDVSLDIYPGETLGIVGESGCGKTTLGRAMIRLNEVTDGQIIFNGQDITHMPEKQLRPLRKDMQIIFQDPYSSLNPRMTVGDIVSEPFRFQKLYSADERIERVKELMVLCGLDPVYIRRYPHEFSGGQRQRIGIARALALNPKFILCDEPVSALDVSVQSQVINLLMDLQEKTGVAYAFISHNLNVVYHMSRRIAVMYLGNLVELADREEIYRHTAHPYTMALLDAIPKVSFDAVDTLQSSIQGDLPSPVDPPSGCVFHTRCPYACERCKQEVPQMREIAPGHFSACHFAERYAR
ncbi:MAG: ABC transporter ATP-binding protein [Candidatus Ventricola sp.]